MLETTIKTDETFLTIPNIYRPDSGLLVNKENLGVLNIPDFLDVQRDTDYLLNKVGIHEDTIKKALKGAGFHNGLINDRGFIQEIQSEMEKRMNEIADGKERKYSILLAEIIEFYQTDVMKAQDVVDVAESMALVK
ncbi:hypothetical protein [Oceanobacillus kimchii]|uniref:hypothetical protein n=1 Tax=Oceanobacillus kimchii TaxID=746691 RepID=UPI0009854043|nr:hypothetical protein [Oceanobacillus kimchii]